MKLRRTLFLLPLLLLAFSCATAPDTTSGTFILSGKTRYQGNPLSSGEVTVLRAEPGGAAYKTIIKEDGTFSLDQPPGSYLLMGKSSDPVSGNDLFAYWTNNPVQLQGNVTDPVVLPYTASTGPPEASAGTGIRGRILHEGKAVPGAVAAAFLDAAGEFHGLPYARSAPSDAKGGFFLNIGPGRYFVVARFKASGGSYQGPLLKGDLAGFYPYNPVTLRTGEGLTADIPMVVVNRPRGEGSLAHGEAIIVKGRVTDITGDPAAGVRVVLYTIPEMLGRPEFISSPSDESGAYRLEVSRAGQYYAAARSVIGRPPETGELMGFYDGTDDHSLLLEIGDRLEGVNIMVREVW